jgi:protein SCO1/2
VNGEKPATQGVQKMSTNKEFPVGTLVLFLSVVTLLMISLLTFSPGKKTIPGELIAVLRPEAIPLKPFTMTDQQGKIYTEQNLKGKWSFFFFGYTYCPDICPTTLSSLKLMTSQLKDEPDILNNTQIIFVSVDPERDTPEVLSSYMNYFGPLFTGITGFPNNLTDLTRQFSAAYIKEKETSPGNYLVSHTSSIFLVDPQARIVASFSPPHHPEIISDLYRQIYALFR